MCDPHQADLQRTLVEANKFVMEKKKIEVEIQKLRKSEQSAWKSITGWRDLLAILSVILTLGVGVHSFSSKLGERNKLLITKAVIDLTQRLGDQNHQGQAAILLSAYGGHAVPVLLNSLRRQASDGLLKALELIGTQEPKAVVPPLRKRVNVQLEAALVGSDLAVQLFQNYVKALGAVGELRNPGETM